MQTAGPPFPGVKITAGVCTKSHLEQRQTLLIWRLLAPTSTSCFTETQNSERRRGQNLFWEAGLYHWWLLHIWDGIFILGDAHYSSPVESSIGWGRVLIRHRCPHSQDHARLKWVVWSQSAKKHADSRLCTPRPARALLLKSTHFASVRQMEPDQEGTSAHPRLTPQQLAFCFLSPKCQIVLTHRYFPECESTLRFEDTSALKV